MIGLSTVYEGLTETLIAAKHTKNVAKTLAFILTNNLKGRSLEIQRATGLKQPEVSYAIKQLRKSGWLIKVEIKKKGKGRPIHEYKLKIPPKQIFLQIKTVEKRKIMDIKKNIKLMESIIKNL